MAAALQDVKDGMSVREAAKLYNLPYETLRRRVIEKVDLECRPGPPTVLTDHEEAELASYCVKMADMGFGLSRSDVMIVAFKIAEVSGRKHPFVDGTAGRAWFDGFRSRHPRLTLHSTQGLSRARASSANHEVISDFFGKLASLSARLNVLMKPMNVFNMDETGVTVVHKGGKVVTEVGRRNVWHITSGEKGKTHTILTCVSAAGFVLPPFLIYPRKRITESLKEGAIAGTVFNCSDSGWVNTELFLTWLKYFAQSIPPSRPVLLILDGHSSHVSIEAIEFARSNDIHMLCIPAHTTHILQPLDVGVFKSFKSFYSKACKKRIAEHPNRVITTEQIASLIGIAWPQSITPVNIMAGFRKCGIYPLNPGEVTDRQLAPSALFTSDDATPDTPSEDSSALADSSSVVSDRKSNASSLSDILVLPKPLPPKKGKPAINAKANCITDVEVLDDLKMQKEEKEAKEEEKVMKQLEKEKKKEERERKKKEKQEEREKKKEEREKKKEEREKKKEEREKKKEERERNKKKRQEEQKNNPPQKMG